MTFNINISDICNNIFNNTLYITITNYGYLLYTMNLLKSLQNFEFNKKILIVCLDTKSEKFLKSKGYNTFLIDMKISKLVSYNKTGYDLICYYKLLFIYKVICLGYNIFYFDGDIVFSKDPSDEINNWINSEKDMFIQNDSMDNTNHNNLCMGLLMVKSNPNTLKYFKCDTDEAIDYYNKFCAMNNNDQTYFNNKIKNNLNVGVMKLEEWPNGKYFYQNYLTLEHTLYAVHFNWLHGHEKLVKIKELKMWYLVEEDEEEL